MDMKSMNIVQLRQYFQELKIDEVKSLLQDGKIAKMGDLELNLLFLNARDEVKKVLLDDKEIFEHLMSMPLNKMKKSFIDLVDEDLREYIYHHENLRFSTSGKVRVCEYLQKLPLNSFRKYLEDDSLDLVYQQDVLTALSNSGLLDSYTKGLVENAIKNFEFRNIALFKLKHPLEVLIYTKFHLLVKVQEVKGDCVVIGDREIAIDFLRRVNKKHITTLISLVLKREANATHEEVLIGILKLYMVFGFDNSKKVLEDTFTYATDLSIKRASVEIFKDVRRAYRLENQNKYYYHGMEDDFLKALESENLEYFKTFVGKEREDEAKNIYQKLEVLQRTFQGQELREQIRGLLLEEIQKREAFYQLRDFMKYTKYYQALKRDKQIQVEDIYLLFSEVNLDYQLSQEGKVLPDLELTKFLLGNCKRDNDCLLRMVLNNEALGLNKELPKIINHFTTISKNISKNSQLSLYSILDVIDISKVFLYHLKPDELDITLSTLSEILNSRKYCTEPPEVIMERTLKLHRDRKKKVSSAIPMISGEYEGVSYSMALFDDEALLVSGIETGSCFKVGGKGEDFLRYCLTDPCGMVFYIEYLGVKYVLPVTR